MNLQELKELALQCAVKNGGKLSRTVSGAWQGKNPGPKIGAEIIRALLNEGRLVEVAREASALKPEFLGKDSKPGFITEVQVA